MDLFAAATFFDDCPAYDAYTGLPVFLCQLSSFNDANAIGSTSIRRVLSTGPGVVIPDRRVVTLMGDQWIVGDGTDDAWDGLAIRQSYNMKKASGLATFSTPAEALAQAGGFQTYIQESYFKDVYDVRQTSDVTSDWNLFLSRTEAVVHGTIVYSGGYYFRVREAYTPLEGIQVTRAYRFELPLQSVIYTSKVYDPLLDAYTDTQISTTALVAPAALLYYRPMETAPQAAPGDLTIYLGFEPTIGSHITYSGTQYAILAYTSEVDAYLVHIRHA